MCRSQPETRSSLRARRSNPEATSKDWIASSQELLAMTANSLLLDAAGFDQLRPFFLVLVDEGGVVFRRARRDLGAVLGELLLHLVGSKRVTQRLVELVDDGPRRAGGRRQTVIQRGIEAGQHGFGNG